MEYTSLCILSSKVNSSLPTNAWKLPEQSKYFLNLEYTYAPG